jgi:hypothetical protein
MKRLSAAVVFVFLVSGFGFAQIQTGNASYNPLKTGFTISHSSLSFNTHVRVTNLLNNLWVDATVNGRIPISTERIADISQEVGDALRMDKTGMTMVEIAILPASPAPASVAAPPPVQDAAPPPQPAKPQPPAPVPQEQEAAPPPAQLPPVQTLTDVRYVPVPSVAQSCCPWPFVLAVLIPLVLAIIVLIVMLAVFLRRLSRWPRHYPFWLRRGYWSGKSKRRGMRKKQKRP